MYIKRWFVANQISLAVSPIQMKHLAFKRMNVSAFDNPNETDAKWVEDFDFQGVNVTTNTTIARSNEDNPEDPRNYMLTIQLLILNEDGKKCPYTVDIEAYAWFELLPKDMPIEKRDDFVHINGASVVIGAMREAILTMTARCVHGSLLLPTLRFLPNETKQS